MVNVNKSALTAAAMLAAFGNSGERVPGDLAAGPGKRSRLAYPERPLYRAGRNKPCPCGSGRKFKKCCLGKTADSSTIPETTLQDTELPCEYQAGGDT
jgi:hypothetical protein